MSIYFSFIEKVDVKDRVGVSVRVKRLRFVFALGLGFVLGLALGSGIFDSKLGPVVWARTNAI